MQTKCGDIERGSSLGVEVDSRSHPGRAYNHFMNRTRMPLWFPAQQEPAFRPDERTKILIIWFGYFDEVYAQHSRDYMTPTMRMVSPGEDLTFEIVSPGIVQKLVDQRLSPQMYARVATRKMAENRTRGEQPLQEYLEYSCVIQSSVVVGSPSAI